jgi:hypothetical protein
MSDSFGPKLCITGKILISSLRTWTSVYSWLERYGGRDTTAYRFDEAKDRSIHYLAKSIDDLLQEHPG